jgi:hypothetical protein
MRNFKDLIEARGDTAVFTLGRFNPPTTGHEKLIIKLDSVAKKNSAPMYVFPTHSNDPAKNPLPHGLKVAYMKKMYKKYAKNIQISKARNVFEVAKVLFDKGHKSIIMVVGSDRVTEFTKLLEKYDGVESTHGYYEFENIEVVSAGERDPDAEGVSGMSASKMRAAAADGDKDLFLQGVPSTFKDGDKLYSDVRKNMGIREERDMGDMSDFETVRDAYLTGKIWNVGDVVESKGVTGEVVRKGTNYLSFVSEDGKVHKAWLHDIQVDETRMSALDKLKKFDKSRTGKSPIFTDKKGQEFVRMKKSGMMSIMNVPSDEIDKYIKKGYDIVEEVELDERNYAKEYANYQGTPEQIARRSSRNKARRVMGDKTKIGMDVGHADNDPMNNDPDNLRNEDPSENRREPRLRETADHRKDYDTFVKMYAQLNKEMDDASEKLKKFPKGQMGMTSDKVKSSPAYKKAKADYEKVSNLTKRFLKGVPKDFMKKNARSKKEEVNEGISDMLPWLKKLTTVSHPRGMENLVKSYTKKVMEPKYKDKPNMAAADVARQTTEISPREFVRYINKLVDKGVLPKKLKAEYEVKEVFSFKEFTQAIQEVKQDKDIDDKKGTQPAKYYAGDMAKSTKDKRDAHFKKKKSGPAPGDADAKTKPSVHTKKFKQMFGEVLPDSATQKDYIDDFEKSDAPQFQGKSKEKRREMAIAAYLSKNESFQLDEKIAGLVKKSDKSGMPYGILKKVYDRGMAAWKTGHRPGTTPQQWAFARVNSFTTKSAGTWGKADKDLAKQVEQIEEACWVGYKQVGMKKKGDKEVPNCVPEDNDLNEWGEITEKDDKSGKELNNPTKGDVKKYKVYVRNDKGNVVKVEFGDPNMEIKRDDPARRKAFRARHNCDQKKDKTTAGYWSCKFWSGKSVTDLMKG